jgi:hypothetical protein
VSSSSLGIKIDGEMAHLVLKLPEIADVMDAALLVECGHRFLLRLGRTDNQQLDPARLRPLFEGA